MSVEDVEGWMEVGELEGVKTNHGIVLPWAELVSFATGFWEQEAIEEALGADVAEAIPELLRLSDLEVRIPRMEGLRRRCRGRIDGACYAARRPPALPPTPPEGHFR
jgi:hypothetical protein